MHLNNVRGVLSGVLLLTSFLPLATIYSQGIGTTNSWIKPTSGFWEEQASWSLGVLPNSSQSVQLTNSGWKAVVITSSTAMNFPNSMTVGNVLVRGASDTVNTLGLDFVGTAVPLTVLNGIELIDSGRIVNFDSALVVQGGTIEVTNAQIIQDGGLVRTIDAPMYLRGSEYHLTNGVFEGGQVVIGLPIPGRFNQYDGTATISDLRFGRGAFGAGGTYALYGGNLNLPNGLTILGGNDSFSSYFQAGGTNRTTTVFLEPDYYGLSPSFTLNGGLLADNDVSMIGDNFGAIIIGHNGGTHIVSNTLTIAGGETHGEAKPSAYVLNGGMLSARTIALAGRDGDALFIQSNGIAQAEQILASANSGWPFRNDLRLAGGRLTCSNLLSDNGVNDIHQYGGVLEVSNALGFIGFRDTGIKTYSRYVFTGGTLFASNIDVGGNWIIGDSSGLPRIKNPGNCRLSHTLQISNAVEGLGRFILAADATIDLAGSASRLSFANSSGETWTNAATLLVAHWNGNLSGGGAEQLKFGNNPSGLTSRQLSQIRFQTGSSSELYSAKILNTGEVVPDRVVGASVAFSSEGSNLVLTFPSGWFLQSATNVVGPYLDISGAMSPYTNDTTLDPQRFFRLRQ